MGDQQARYVAGVAQANEAVANASTREAAVERIVDIADSLRRDDPLFLYREFFADIRVSDWEEFYTEDKDV